MAKPTWIGKTLGGRYQIDELLGQGGMSAVYKATDPNLNRVVAVKLIHPHLSGDPEFVRRFEQEARAVAQLRHPHIIQVYDFDHDEEVYYIVFEFIPGESLQQRLKRMHAGGRRMELEQIVLLTAQVADALDYAHNRNLIHRDVKPANVMLNVQNEPILMDFGIVKMVGGTHHTATGATMGTARYMSPEQIKGEKIDERTDIYALGVMLFEMAAGRAPYEADSAMTIMMMHLNDPVPNLSTLRPNVPPDLKAIIEKALAKDPAERFQTAGEMAAALSSANLEAPAAAATVFEPPPSTPPRARPAATGTAPPASGPPTTGQRPAAPPPQPAPANRRRMVTIGVGALLGVLLLACIVAGALIFSNFAGGGDDVEPGALDVGTLDVAEGTPDELGEIVEEDEETPSPTATRRATATATRTPTATAAPDYDNDGIPDDEDNCPQVAQGANPAPNRPGCPGEPTRTPRPTITPSPTLPPGMQARILGINIESGVYVVAYETYEYTEQLPGQHVHFFYDTVSEEQAGVPGGGPWIAYGGPRPFRDYSVASRPAGAEQMCILVANPDHSIIPDTGNCWELPES